MIWTPIVTGRTAALALARLRAWPVDSQQRARRNAMVAATACAQRRAERADVESFLRERYRPAAEGPDSAEPVRRAARG